MMFVPAGLIAILAAALTSIFAALLIRSAPSGLTIENFRGVRLPVIGGIAIAAAYICTEAVVSVIGLVSPFTMIGRTTVMLLALGFFALGAIDDLAGAGQARGFRGHIKALSAGRLTGGAIKAFGGFALAFVVAASWEVNLLWTLVDASIIALSANLLNLLDLRPGRAAKAFIVLWIALVVVSGTGSYGVLTSAFAGAGLVWVLVDLRETAMLGDSGANMLGAVVGAGVVLNTGGAARVVIGAVLILLTLVSERFSFTRAIDRFGPLRFIDRLGRRAPFA